MLLRFANFVNLYGQTYIHECMENVVNTWHGGKAQTYVGLICMDVYTYKVLQAQTNTSDNCFS